MWIIEDENSFSILEDVNIEIWFHVMAFFCSVSVIIFDINIGLYTKGLLFLYILMVWGSVTVLMKIHHFSFRKAIANSFLIVYLNSWYWESFMHIWAIQENGLNMNQLFQALHLIPAIYFIIRYKFDIEKASMQLFKGFIFSALIGMMINFRVWKYLPIVHTDQTVFFFNHVLILMNRLICLVYLFNAIIIWGKHKKDHPKLMRQTDILNT
jgi:hypothetical protein